MPKPYKYAESYRKERKRVLDYISRAKRSGYEIQNEAAIREALGSPKKAPTRRQVESLQSKFSTVKLSKRKIATSITAKEKEAKKKEAEKARQAKAEEKARQKQAREEARASAKSKPAKSPAKKRKPTNPNQYRGSSGKFEKSPVKKFVEEGGVPALVSEGEGETYEAYFVDPDTGEVLSKASYTTDEDGEVIFYDPYSTKKNPVPVVTPHVLNEMELVYNNFLEQLENYGFLAEQVDIRKYGSISRSVDHLNNTMIAAMRPPTEDKMLAVYYNHERLTILASIVQNYEEGYLAALSEFLEILAGGRITLEESAELNETYEAYDSVFEI